MKRVVTTPIIKSNGVPRPSAGGGGAFQWWGGAPGWQTGAGFMMICFLNAVTNLILRSGPVAERWELSQVLPNRRDRQVAARAGILPSLSTGQAQKMLQRGHSTFTEDVCNNRPPYPVIRVKQPALA